MKTGNLANQIVIRGARVNNLKNLDCEIPREKLTVICGLSGSGKSSLAFETIFAEGQRRYLESLSSFARQFLGVLEKPDVDEIKNLSPAIAIDQLSSHRSPRSTVGTMSETYDYLRILFANIGKIVCPHCQTQALKNSSAENKFYFCPQCKKNLGEISVSTFSFNSPYGACEKCQGLGKHLVIDKKSLIPNLHLTIAEGAVRVWQRLNINNYWIKRLSLAAFKEKIPVDLPIIEFQPEQIKNLFYGLQQPEFPGLIRILSEKYEESNSEYIKREIEKNMNEEICSECQGARLNKIALNTTIRGKNILELAETAISDLPKLLRLIYLKLNETEKAVSQLAINELIKRLDFLIDVGLGYLTLSRNAQTLAGGEAQRIRLATQLGSGLIGVTYILDEPSIGLHSVDHHKIIEALKNLRDLGNTIIVVEHDEQTIRSADYILDIGPGAGELGGKVVASGNLQDILASKSSLTGSYLNGKKKMAAREKKQPGKNYLKISGAQANNLKNLNVAIPLECLVAITGVSGSGKSTLINDILAKHLLKTFYRARENPAPFKEIKGLTAINKVVVVDQSPIGRNSRSNPATYTGVFTHIRELFANLAEAKKAKLEATDFSFNLKGGRCENCKGEGTLKFEMNFLPNVYVACEKCRGLRFTKKILDIKFKDRHISQILAMSVNEALIFFSQFEKITQILKVLQEVGLGYVKLGQPAPTLSGGEAQRVKLAAELARASTGKTLYILDEPTTGLHFEDISKLLVVLNELVKKHNSVIVIEHNLDIIKNADWVIDLGPEGGEKGGEIVAEGPPREIRRQAKSHTAKALKNSLV